ncbi:histidine phosphatase family protein [Flavobacterium sp.]|uniref:SixA phosphatase family protein n=1 Tax=Flavobacterium sp. TaxID=239 RepID=UPI003527B2DA
MKTLILIRHSKSSWESPLNDIDRPLSVRGIADAHLIFSKINAILPKTFIVWSSVARRTKESALLFSQNLDFLLENIQFKNELYTFDETQLEHSVKNCENKYDNLILFGHNNAITNFVNKFGDFFLENVPTTGVVKLQFDTNNWEHLKKGTIVETIFPSHFKHESN